MYLASFLEIKTQVKIKKDVSLPDAASNISNLSSKPLTASGKKLQLKGMRILVTLKYLLPMILLFIVV
ncbi:hypothetical protein [Borreliella americana]|uniref:hypothetical protein n=1 Tax=Borreliella americana TaxID=478807 RepID=UPI001E2A8822|nr:hypothetical protein [Borreliella americana]MCD2382033.1 hypothetical protein [Borreliella americana]